MIHPENWEKISKEFCVSIGMLIQDGTPLGTEGFPVPHKLNKLILRGITEGNYSDIRREVLRLERMLRTNTRELTLYNKAIKSDITAKSREVF